MGVMIQVKDVPEEANRVLKARAARDGLTLAEMARRTLVEASSRPSRATGVEVCIP